MFDILQCHGSEIFADLSNDGQEKLEFIITDIWKSFEHGDYENDEVLKGVLKLFMVRTISSPAISTNVLTLYFHPDGYSSAQCELEKFFQSFGQTKPGYNCLAESFLSFIDMLFDASKKSSFYEIGIKKDAMQLIEFSNSLESQKQYNEDKFQDLLALKLCRRFLKKPWRLSASDLCSVCSHIKPKPFDTLVDLKELVVQVTEKKNPYAKKSMKNFSGYLKKIQQAIAAAPLHNARQEVIISPIQKRLLNASPCSPLQDDMLPINRNLEIDTSSVCSASSTEENRFQSPINAPDSSVQSSPSSANETLDVTPESPPKRTATRSRLSRKTPGPSSKKAVSDNTFKTPAPQKYKTLKQQLDITLTKTC